MEHQKILNLLNEAIDSKFVTRKWNIVIDNSSGTYDVGMKLSLIQKFQNLNFMITTMLTFYKR